MQKKCEQPPLTMLTLEIAILIDMGWQKRSTGLNYHSLSGNGFQIRYRIWNTIEILVKRKGCAVGPVRVE